MAGNPVGFEYQDKWCTAGWNVEGKKINNSGKIK